MADTTSTIGTTGRDYATLTLWEAAGYNSTPAANRAVADCYNDGPIDEGSGVVLNDDTPTSLLIRAANATEEHDGSRESGVRFIHSSSGQIIDNQLSIDCEVVGLEVDANDVTVSTNNSGVCITARNAHGSLFTVRRCLAYGFETGAFLGSSLVGMSSGMGGNFNVHNSFVFGLRPTDAMDFINNAGIDISHNPFDAHKVLNVTIHDIYHSNEGTGKAVGGIKMADDSDYEIRNVMVTRIVNDIPSGDTFGMFTNTPAAISNAANAVGGHNLTDDTMSAASALYDATEGAGSVVTGVAYTNQYESTVRGSEDLKQKAGADSLAAGKTLTSPTNVEFDILNLDRTVSGDPTDIGGHQLETGSGVSQSLLTSWESLASISSGPASRWESLGHLSSGLITRWESQGHLSQAQTTMWESLLSLANASVVQWEALGDTRQPVPSSWESAGTVNSTNITHWESSQSILQSTITQWESVLSINQSAVALWESLVGVANASISLWESLGVLTSTSTTHWEAQQRVLETQTTHWEAAEGIARAVVHRWEALGLISTAAISRWESIGILSSTATTYWEAQQSLVASQMTLWEAGAQIARAGVSRWESLGLISSTAVSRWEAAGSLIAFVQFINTLLTQSGVINSQLTQAEPTSTLVTQAEPTNTILRSP